MAPEQVDTVQSLTHENLERKLPEVRGPRLPHLGQPVLFGEACKALACHDLQPSAGMVQVLQAAPMVKASRIIHTCWRVHVGSCAWLDTTLQKRSAPHTLGLKDRVLKIRFKVKYALWVFALNSVCLRLHRSITASMASRLATDTEASSSSPGMRADPEGRAPVCASSLR